MFGIYNHLSAKSNLSNVELHSNEDFIKNNLYEHYLNVFVALDIYTKLGISFDEFINKPKYEIEAIIKVIENLRQKEDKIRKEVNEKISNKIDVDLNENKS